MTETNTSCECSCKGSGVKRDDLLSMINDYKDIPGSLITVLHRAQGIYGYLPKEVIDTISKRLNIPISKVMGIVTFYSFYSTTPKGKYNLQVCMGTACYVRGAERVLEKFSKELGIDEGGTTDDKLFSLTHTRCIGACGLAPVVSVSGEIHREVKDSEVVGIIKECRNK